MLEKLISSFIPFTVTRHIFAGTDSTGLTIHIPQNILQK